MANKLDRIEKDIAKTKAKITELQKQLRELEAAKTEQENLQIIQLVRGLNMKPEDFAAFLRGGALQTARPRSRILNRRTMPMKNKIIRTFTVTLAAVLCLTAFSTTAFAGGTDPDPEPLPETTEAPQEEEPTTGGMEPEGVPVTPEGNATLVDDFYGDKQLITVTTKAGNYFYILIDRANEDKETAVHFLNQVDDADLQALLEDGEAAPETCTCTTKCEAGAVNTNCPVCKTNMTECTGPEPEPQEPEETEPPQEDEPKSTGMGGLVVFLVVALIGGGAALYFFKFKKPKADTKGGDELDEYDFGEDEDDEDEPTPEDEVNDSTETDKE